MRDPPLLEGSLTRDQVHGAWGEWLSGRWDWDWWVTLTYDPRKVERGSSTHTAVGWARSQADWDRWLAELSADRAKSDALAEPYWFRGREPNPYRYGTHFHALIGGLPADVSRRDAWRRWFDRHGHARIEPYDPSRGAGWYVAKYVTKTLGDLTFSPNAGLWMKKRESDDGRRDDGGRFGNWHLPDGWLPRT